ncbi:MAG: lipopolysaccharide heptosyltransferase II [Campylobacterales bacterium]
MKSILIELPTWLGDAVMATPAFEALAKAYPDAKFTIVGSPVATAALGAHPQVSRILIDTSRQQRGRLSHLKKLAHDAGPHDLALSFRASLASKFFLWMSSSRRTIASKRSFLDRILLSDPVTITPTHQVLKYLQLLAPLGIPADPAPLKLHHTPYTYPRPTLGLNPGATYGSAKRWYPERFAAVATQLSRQYDIVIFGGPGEEKIADEIAWRLHQEGLLSVNLAGKTTVKGMIERVAGLSLFITNDSGPMHVAAAYGVPTVAIFGPTDDTETSPWMARSRIVRHKIDCAPCKKRICPLGHHECMKGVTADMVLLAAQSLIDELT